MTAPTLPEFLLTRLAERAALAKAAQEGAWYVSGEVAAEDAVAQLADPARVLADVEAKRRIVALHHERDISPSCAECGGYTATVDNVRGITHHGYAIPWPCPTLRLLALPYADHPDYREEWKP